MKFDSENFEKKTDKHYNYGYERTGETYCIFEIEVEPGVTPEAEPERIIIAENIAPKRTD